MKVKTVTIYSMAGKTKTIKSNCSSYLAAAELVRDGAGRALALVRPDSVDTERGGRAGRVLALVDVDAAAVGEDVAGLALAARHVVTGAAGAAAAVHTAARINTPAQGIV